MSDFSLIKGDLAPLRIYGMMYMASPYSKYHGGIEQAAKEAALISGRIMQHGVNVFSPVVYTHTIAMVCNIDPFDYDFWMGIDYKFMDLCDALLVAEMPGWDISYGIGLEIEYFKKHDKAIFHLETGICR